MGIANGLPDPGEGPTPPETRVAYYLLFAACVIALASIPLLMGAVERLAGARSAVAWRLLLVARAVLAMLVLGWGVRTWADPPHNLRECFTDYRGNGHSGIWGHICNSGLANVPLGETGLEEGVLGAVIILFGAGIAAARMALPPPARPTVRPGPPAPGRADGR